MARLITTFKQGSRTVRLRICLSTTICLLFAPLVHADTLPLWRLGIGPAGLVNPHYLGAEQDNRYFLPIPYFEYNGEVLKADRNGVRGIIYEKGNFAIGFSGSGSLPVDSDDNDARAGMSDLDFILEPGLAAQYTIYKSSRTHWRIDLPVRTAIALADDGPEHVGWTSYPRVYNATRFGPWTVTSTAGVLYGDRDYHGYFYDVAGADVRPDRPQYMAQSGISATRLSVSVKRNRGRFFYGGFLTYYNLDDAANRDSSLVRERDNYAAGFIVAWIFRESSTRVRQSID